MLAPLYGSLDNSVETSVTFLAFATVIAFIDASGHDLRKTTILVSSIWIDFATGVALCHILYETNDQL